MVFVLFLTGQYLHRRLHLSVIQKVIFSRESNILKKRLCAVYWGCTTGNFFFFIWFKKVSDCYFFYSRFYI